MFLVWDAGRLADEAMVDYFRVRATAAGMIAGVVAVAGLFVVHEDATYLFDGLTSRALPFVLLSAFGGVGALLLLRGRPHRGGRLAAVTAAAGLVLAWGVAQWDYLLPTSLTVSDAAAPDGTLKAVMVAAALFVALIVPSQAMLYTLDQKDLLVED